MEYAFKKDYDLKDYDKTRAPFCPLKITPHGYGELETAYNGALAECFKAKADRDYYKSHADMLECERVNLIGNLDIMQKRAEALERAVKNPKFQLGAACLVCVNNSKPVRPYCDDCGDNCENWQFDYERFAKAGEQNG